MERRICNIHKAPRCLDQQKSESKLELVEVMNRGNKTAEEESKTEQTSKAQRADSSELTRKLIEE